MPSAGPRFPDGVSAAPPRRARPGFALPLLALLLGSLTACAPARPPHYTVFAMDGPPLAIVGGRLGGPDGLEGPDGPLLRGRMERAGMVGNGEIEIELQPEGLICRGRLKDGPAENGKVRGLIPCLPRSPAAAPGAAAALPERPAREAGRVFLFLTIGHHGPDQGLGVARLARLTRWDGESSPAAPDGANSGGGEIRAEDLEISGEPPLLFYYHPWDEEAGRRYLEAKSNLERGRAKKE